MRREKERVSIKEREVSNLGIKPEGGLQKVVFREKERRSRKRKRGRRARV